MILSEGQAVFVVPGGGRVVHLTLRCRHVRGAKNYVSKTVNEVRAAVAGEPKVCQECQKITRG